MPPDVPKWLEDIRDAAAYIQEATKEVTQDALANDRLPQLLVEVEELRQQESP